MHLKQQLIMGAALSVALSAQAFAQDKPAPAKSENQAAQMVEEIVVTGSRLKSKEFISPEPIQVVTAESALAQGIFDATELIQSTPAASGTQQISDVAFLTPDSGGFGANTIDLRGLGAARTLTLLNGHRVGPAGISGRVGSADLNVIPTSIIARTETLPNGASSIYGSDAVAGVVNIITKELDGGSVRLNVNAPQRHGGGSQSISLGWGTRSDRGSLTVGAYAYQAQSLRNRDRDYLNCALDLAYDPTTGERLDIKNPDGSYKCWGNGGYIFKAASATGATLLNASGYFTPDAGVTAGTTSTSNLNGYRRFFSTSQDPVARYDGYYPWCSGGYCRSDQHIRAPVRRFSLSAFWDYDLTPNLQVYGEALATRRTSVEDTVYSLNATVNALNPNNPFNYNNNKSFVSAAGAPLANATATAQMQYMQQTAQTVNFYNGLLGLRGDFKHVAFLQGTPLASWDWDVYGQFSQSRGEYSQNFFYADRVTATTGALACDTSVLTSIAQCPAGGVNYVRAFSQGFTPEEAAFLIGRDTGHTVYEQAYIEGLTRGDLFRLPAGPIEMALGFHLRRERINDMPGPNATNRSTIINWDPTWKPTKGSEGLNEVYGEANIPLLRDLPFARRLNLSISGRWSDYEDFKAAETYKVGLMWRPTDWLMLRSSQGTSFRGPRLYEMFLQPSQALSGRVTNDPCNSFQTKQDSLPPAVFQSCKALFPAGSYTAAGNATIITSGGLGLDPERSRARSAGFVLTPKFADLNVAVDYYDIHIITSVAQVSAYNIAYLCLLSGNGASDPFCKLVTRNADGQLNSVISNYTNQGDAYARGLDVLVRYKTPTPVGKLTLSGSFNWTFENSKATLTDSPLNAYNGNIGYPDFNGVKRRPKLTPNMRPKLTPLRSVPGPAARRVAVS